jgi:hypothetical protein
MVVTGIRTVGTEVEIISNEIIVGTEVVMTGVIVTGMVR